MCLICGRALDWAGHGNHPKRKTSILHWPSASGRHKRLSKKKKNRRPTQCAAPSRPQCASVHRAVERTQQAELPWIAPHRSPILCARAEELLEIRKLPRDVVPTRRGTKKDLGHLYRTTKAPWLEATEGDGVQHGEQPPSLRPWIEQEFWQLTMLQRSLEYTHAIEADLRRRQEELKQWFRGQGYRWLPKEHLVPSSQWDHESVESVFKYSPEEVMSKVSKDRESYYPLMRHVPCGSPPTARKR